MRVGRLLKNYRKRNEITLRELSAQIGIGAATLMRIEQGRIPDGATLAKLLHWLMEDK